MTIRKIVIVGAGPAGMMAAIRAAQCGARVTLIEKNPSCGRKLLLSGKGRCNLTNACGGLDVFLSRFPASAQFLRDAFKKLFNRDLIDFFEKRGLKMSVERQDRVFPAAGASAGVLSVLVKELNLQHVNVVYKQKVETVAVAGQEVEAVICAGRRIEADAVILATGGVSYAFTGSTGDGLTIACSLGHSVVESKPGLVPLVAKESWVSVLEGLTLKNIRVTFREGNRRLRSNIGELIFTHSGISGPLILTHSGAVVDLFAGGRDVSVEIDLKPGLSLEQLDARLLREFALNSRKTVKNICGELMPRRMVACFLERAGVDSGKQASAVTRRERSQIAVCLKAFRLRIAGSLPIEEAMVTRGGVSLKEINPRTMESRLIKGLYFAGEMIDVDADTGGFNLQAAFSTGYLAGESAAVCLRVRPTDTQTKL